MKFHLDRFKDKKLLLYSNQQHNEFAIKEEGESDFRIRSDDTAMYTEMIDEMKSSAFQNLTPTQILGIWKSWVYNIYEEDYEFLKKENILHLIKENEKVALVTLKRFLGHSHVILYDKVIVTNKRILLVIADPVGIHLNWKPYSILFKDINSIELTKGLFSIFGCDIQVRSPKAFKIIGIKKSVAKEIVDYINQHINDK